MNPGAPWKTSWNACVHQRTAPSFTDLANSWRRYYNIPEPSASNSAERQFPVLPQPDHGRFSAGQSTSWIPDHTYSLQSCWGRSATRFSQGDPSPALLRPVSTTMTTLPSTLASQTSDHVQFPAASADNHLGDNIHAYGHYSF